jgi:hypothetical protein
VIKEAASVPLTKYYSGDNHKQCDGCSILKYGREERFMQGFGEKT